MGTSYVLLSSRNCQAEVQRAEISDAAEVTDPRIATNVHFPPIVLKKAPLADGE